MNIQTSNNNWEQAKSLVSGVEPTEMRFGETAVYFEPLGKIIFAILKVIDL